MWSPVDSRRSVSSSGKLDIADSLVSSIKPALAAEPSLSKLNPPQTKGFPLFSSRL